MVTTRGDDDPTLPSDAELKLLRELWEHGEQSVGELHERVQGYWPVGYTTVLKLLQRMTDKELVARRPEGRAHQYRAAVGRERTERRVARSFLQRTFDGSLEALLQSALPTGGARAREIEEIRRLLDRLED
ncbi:MAG TPA: BlaI/MecI/CopY family transcriptional regulator [Alphaproteobacteria bacterium]|nr:BlaI/MecI/CopY family transcriptional regulator [Alphaproteobacteria bacterium]